jgi:hypothetical protein
VPAVRREGQDLKRLICRIVVASGLASFGVLGSAGIASANTVTIGSDLAKSSDSNTCTIPCLAVQQSQPGGSGPFSLTSPANGVVTEWAIRSSDNVTNAFRILRPAGPNTYTGAGTALGVDPGSVGKPLVRNSVSLPIKQGDAIGIAAVAGDSDAGIPQHDTPGVTSNVWATNALGLPPDGASASFTPEPGHELLLQATVKFCLVPNVHKLKKVAAKQALAAADCGVRVKKKETNKRKFRGKVLKQKKPVGTTGAPGTVVPIVIGQK